MKRQKETSKKPLKNCVFYLDVKSGTTQSKLAHYVTTLGGVIEEFLDKKVKYVITDRHQKDWLKKEKKDLNHLNASNLLEINDTINSPVKKGIELLSRGKLLALKAGTTQLTSAVCVSQSSTKTTTDVIEVAYKRGIKLIPAQNLLDFCSQYLEKTGQSLNNEEKTDYKLPSIKAKQLKAPFIKLEDSEEKYRPFVKEFIAWPEIIFDSEPYISPLASILVKTQKAEIKIDNNNNDNKDNNSNTNNNVNVNNINNNININNDKNTDNDLNNNNNNNQVDKKVDIEGKKKVIEARLNDNILTQESKSGIANTITSFTTNKSFTTRSLNGNKSLEGLMLLKHQIVETKDNRHYMRKKSHSIQFCEICNQQYNDMLEHLNTEKHQTYVRQKENYMDLFGVIKSLPKWKDLYTNNSDLSDSCESDGEAESNLSLTPSSLSSTTITLTSGSAKALSGCNNICGSFFPLHDYVTIKSKLSQQSSSKKNDLHFSPPNKLRKKLKDLEPEENDQDKEIIEPSCLTPNHFESCIFRFYSNDTLKSDLKLNNCDQKELLKI